MVMGRLGFGVFAGRRVVLGVRGAELVRRREDRAS